jgi:hypothetical protein
VIARNHVNEVLETLQTAETHVDTEYVDDLEGTLASVSASPRYAFMPAPGSISIIQDSAGVRQFYVNNKKEFEPVASRIITHVATDWYEFQENVPTRRLVATGELVTLNTVNIFPKAHDGIQGEFLWQRSPQRTDHSADHDATGPRGESLPSRALRNAENHERFLYCLRHAQLDELCTLLDPHCLWAGREYRPDEDSGALVAASGVEEVRSLLQGWVDDFAVERLSVLNRVSSEWYVFAEVLLTVRLKTGTRAGRLQEFRKAAVYPFAESGLIQGELGYGTAAGEPSVLSEREVGRIHWIQAGVDVDPGRRARGR